MRKFSIILTLLLTILSISCFAEFKITTSGFDKYTEIETIKGVGNWVKSQQGKRIAFDMSAGKNAEGKTDHFLILEVTDGFFEVFPRTFRIGDHMFLTLNQSEKIKLPVSSILSQGSFIAVRNATGKFSVYLNEETYNKLLNANYVYFEIQASQRYKSEYNELTGYLEPQNIKNLRNMRMYD